MKGKFTLISMLLFLMFSVGQLNAQWLNYLGDSIPDVDTTMAVGDLDFSNVTSDHPGANMVTEIIDDDANIKGNFIFKYEQPDDTAALGTDHGAASVVYTCDLEDQLGFTDSVFTVIIRMKGSGVASDSIERGIGIAISNGAAGTCDTLLFTPSNSTIWLANANVSKKLDTILVPASADLDEWHIYRIVVNGDVYSVYFDEFPKPFLTDTSLTATAAGNKTISIGDFGPETYGGYLDYILLDTSGAAIAPGRGNVIPISLRDTAVHACVARWNFNGDLTDATGNGYDLDQWGVPDYVYALTDSALDNGGLDTLKGTLTIDDSRGLMFGINSFSVTATVQSDDWSNLANHHGTGNESFALIKGQFGTNVTTAESPYRGVRYALHFKNDRVMFTIDDDVSKIQVNGEIEHTKWRRGDYNQMVGVRDTEKDSCYIYLNGELLAGVPDNCATMMPDSIPLGVGGLGYYVPKEYRYVNGQIDQAEIYNYALTPVEITAMYAAMPNQIPQPVSHWDFSEVAADTVADIVGGATGTRYGDELVFVEGMDGNAADFNQINDTSFIHVPWEKKKHLDFDSVSFAVSALVKIDPFNNPGHDNYIINNGWIGNSGTVDPVTTDTVGKGHCYNLTAKDGQIRFTLDSREGHNNGDGKSQLGADAEYEYPLKQWAHVVGMRVIEDTALYLYVNGVLVGERHDVSAYLDLDSVPITIGSSLRKDAPVSGLIDDIQIYDTTLSENDIWNLYNILAPDIVINKPPVIASAEAVKVAGDTIDPAKGIDEVSFNLYASAVDQDTIPFDTLMYSWKVNTNAFADSLEAIASFTNEEKDTASVTIDSALASGYTMTLIFTVDDGQHKVSEDVEITAYYKPIVGVWESRAKENAFSLYPIPADKMLTISIPGEVINTQARLVDQSGRLLRVISLNSNLNTIDVSDLRTGVYYISIDEQSVAFIKK